MAIAFASPLATPAAAGCRQTSRSDAARIAAMFDDHFVPVWRFLRRLGVPTGDVDDHAQEVMLVASRKLDQIEYGKERGFLLGVAYRIASDARRAIASRRETDDDMLEEREDPSPDPEMLADQLHARAVLDQLLQGMPLDFRAVFVLTELDELSMAEISELLGLPPGTVASRLRRGREYFDEKVRRLQARFAQAGGVE
ncbi:MAG: sigma-70 family RNA polymerase sigma factor [Deltaproteobacteria bacterium]|nr:sigma-70 family RNA polymerase sigma factor [Deltaproteobacteria bacterium]